MTSSDHREEPARTAPCPAWCRTVPREHEQDDPGAWLHEGPAFGLLRTWCLDGPEPVFTATLAETGGCADELSPDDLRQLATDALDAAMWMDRQARVLSYDSGVSVVELVRRAHDHSSRSA